MNVAVITRTLRADACVAFMTSVSGASRYAILTADPGAFSRDEEGAAGYEVVRLATGSLPVDGVGIAMATRRKLLGWARSGSRVGRLVESVARGMVRVRRRVARPSRAPATTSSRNDQLYEKLTAINQEERIDNIYVFDLFDLPTALDFSDEFNARVLVR